MVSQPTYFFIPKRSERLEPRRKPSQPGTAVQTAQLEGKFCPETRADFKEARTGGPHDARKKIRH